MNIIKRLSDLCDSHFEVSINDYVNEDFKQDQYQNVFKKLDKFYYKLQKMFEYTKAIAKSSSVDSSSSTITDIKIDTIEIRSHEELSLGANSPYELRCEQIDFTSVSAATVNEPIENEYLKVLKQEEEYFLKYNLKDFKINLDDCMQTMFKNQKIPIKLTSELKEKLKLDTVQTPPSKKNQRTLDTFVLKSTTRTNSNTTNAGKKRKRSTKSAESDSVQSIQLIDATQAPSTPNKRISKNALLEKKENLNITDENFIFLHKSNETIISNTNNTISESPIETMMITDA